MKAKIAKTINANPAISAPAPEQSHAKHPAPSQELQQAQSTQLQPAQLQPPGHNGTSLGPK